MSIKPKSIKLKDIIVDEKFQMRSGGLDEHHVQELQAVIGDGGQFKDPIVVFDIDSLNYHLVDGFHRFEAASREGWRSIKAIIHEGTEGEAIVYAEEANLKHGLALSTQDRKDILFNRFQRGHLETLKTGEQIHWSCLSNAFLASLLGVGVDTIRRWIEEYLTLANATLINRDEVYGGDGRLYNMSLSKEANRERASDTSETDPTDDLTTEEQVVLQKFMQFYDSLGYQNNHQWLHGSTVFQGDDKALATLVSFAKRGLIEQDGEGYLKFRPLQSDGDPATDLADVSYDLTEDEHEIVQAHLLQSGDGNSPTDDDPDDGLSQDERAVLQMVKDYYTDNHVPRDKMVFHTKFFPTEDHAAFRYYSHILRELATKGHVRQSGTNLFSLTSKPIITSIPKRQPITELLPLSDDGFEEAVLDSFAEAWDRNKLETDHEWLDVHAVFGARNITDQARRNTMKTLAEKGYVARHTIKQNHYRLLHLPSDDPVDEPNDLQGAMPEAQSAAVEGTDTPPLDVQSTPAPDEGQTEPDLPDGYEMKSLQGTKPLAVSSIDDDLNYLIRVRSEFEKALFDLEAAMKVVSERRSVNQWGKLGRTALTDTAKVCSRLLKQMPECQTHVAYLKSSLLRIADELPLNADQDDDTVIEPTATPQSLDELIPLPDKYAGGMHPHHLRLLRSQCTRLFTSIPDAYDWISKKASEISNGRTIWATDLQAHELSVLRRDLATERDNEHTA